MLMIFFRFIENIQNVHTKSPKSAVFVYMAEHYWNYAYQLTNILTINP